MTGKVKNNAGFTVADAIDSLPEMGFDPEEVSQETDMKRAELLQSVLTIADLDHVTESEIVREVVRNALGDVPNLDE